MSVGPIYWGSYPGDMLEKVMAVLLAQEHPGAQRREPSGGDGGVDVMIPGVSGWDVRQIKGFVGRMKSGRRKKVEKSFAELMRDPRLRQPVERWSLVVPIDPTSQEQKWFEEMIAEAPFPCEWAGEIYWHGMAARYPHVIDYYLRDGRGRIEARSEALLSAANGASGPLSAMDVVGHLEVLRAVLNREDPHYRYEFHTGDPRVVVETPPGTVLAESRSLESGGILTTFVIERHRYATVDAPIKGTITVTVHDPVRGIDLREPFEEFQIFGTEFELPEGSLDVSMDAPGGFGGTYKGIAGRIGPTQVAGAPPRTRLRIAHPDEVPVVELGLQTKSVTRGDLGGVALMAADDAGVLEIRIRLWPKEEKSGPKFDISLRSVHGRPVLEVLSAVQLVASFKPPFELTWLEEYGSRVLASLPFAEEKAMIPLPLVRFLENLATVQGHVRGTMVVPENIDKETVRSVATVAEIIRKGELSGTWSDMKMDLKEGVKPADVIAIIGEEGSLAVESTWALEIEDRVYELGVMHQIAASARLADEQPSDGRSIRLVAGSDNTMIQRLGPLPGGS